MPSPTLRIDGEVPQPLDLSFEGNILAAVERLRSGYVQQYLTRLHYAGINKQEGALHPDLAAALQ